MKYVLLSFFILILGVTGVFAPLRDAVVSIVSPIQFGLQKTAFNLKQAGHFFSDSNKVRNENLNLLNTIKTLEEEVTGLKIFRDENLLLKQQLAIQKSFDGDGRGQKLILADMMGNPSDLSENTVLINKGTKDGVRVNDIAVIGNYLVGITRSVEYGRSTVELITSPNLSLTAYDLDSPDKASGLLKGQHGSLLSLERVLQNEKISVGDVVVTSGKDGTFLPNLIVGKIIVVQSDPSQPLKMATLQTMIDVSKLIEVFIIQQ